MPPPNIPFSTNVATFIEQTTKPRLNSPVVWATSLGTASVQVVAANLGRTGIFFTNASAVNVYVCPALDGNGNPLSAGGAGSLLLTPGQWVSFSKETACTAAWNAAAASGSGNAFTVWEFL